jgi:cytochrome c-type biogenesis protein CcsB
MSSLYVLYITKVCYVLSAGLYLVFLFTRVRHLNRAALAVLIIGAVAHPVGMAWRMVIAGHPPLTNLFETINFFTWVIVMIYLVTEFKYRLDILGSFIMPLVCLILLVAAPSTKEITPLLPALKSNWLAVHVTLSFLSYGGFAVAFGVGIAYLIQEHQLKSHRIGKMHYRLPALGVLDELVYRLITLAFPFLTLGIITGAIWANQAWGSYWSWDPKETWALVTWLVYAFYLHVRFRHGWRGRKSAYLAIVGFAIVIFTYLGVNLLFSGLHTYL